MQPTAMTPADLAGLSNLPLAMRELPQWLLWRFERYAGDKKPRKVPYYVSGRKRRGTQGSAEDRAELKPWDVAMGELSRGRFDGLGFAFLPGDGLIGIDIDGAISDDGEVSDRCQAIVAACASYTEYSPSGRGVHIIVRGQTPSFKDNGVGLEVFCGRQFFTCTGRRWPGTPPDVAPVEDATLRRLRATVKGGKAQRAAAPPVAPQAGGGDLPAGSGELYRDAATDPACGTGDQRDLSVGWRLVEWDGAWHGCKHAREAGRIQRTAGPGRGSVRSTRRTDSKIPIPVARELRST